MNKTQSCPCGFWNCQGCDPDGAYCDACSWKAESCICNQAYTAGEAKLAPTDPCIRLAADQEFRRIMKLHCGEHPVFSEIARGDIVVPAEARATWSEPQQTMQQLVYGARK